MEKPSSIISWGLSHISTIELYNSLPSTNSFARSRLKAGAQHATVIWALQQTAGRGRLGRTWVSDNNSLTLSVLWRLSDYSFIPLLPLAVGLGVVQSLHSLTTQIKVKWPNDLWIGSRKLGGILGESVHAQGALWVIIGIGLNVNGRFHNPSIPSISLEESIGERFSRFGILNLVLDGLDQGFSQLKQGTIDLDADFRRYGNFIDREIQLVQGANRWQATARAVLPDGRLLIEDAQGIRAVLPEEVSLRFR